MNCATSNQVGRPNEIDALLGKILDGVNDASCFLLTHFVIEPRLLSCRGIVRMSSMPRKLAKLWPVTISLAVERFYNTVQHSRSVRESVSRQS